MQPEGTTDRQLARAVEKLTRRYEIQHTQRMPGGGRRLVSTTHDPLIMMLRTAGTPSLGEAGSSPSARMLADADAIEKLRNLRADIDALWEYLVPGAVRAGFLRQKGLTHEAELVGWHQLFAVYRRRELVHTDDFEWACRIVIGWEHTIEARFDPPTIIESTSPCPECRNRWAESSIGDRVTAITYTIGRPLDTTSASCRACGRTWRGVPELRELAKSQGALFG